MEYAMRDYCFKICVDMIASALGRCEFRTFKDRAEVFGRDYYLFNVEPNANENSSMFLHKLVNRLYMDNEALVISTRRRDGFDALVVADSFQSPETYPARQNEYRGVTVGPVGYEKTFRENEVLHLKLSQKSVKSAVDALYGSYYRLLDAAMRRYRWQNGQHWKVHVDRIAQGDDAFEENFRAMIREQIKPFFDADNAIFPEYDGYRYEDVSAKGGGDTRDIKALFDDIFDFTARAVLIPPVLLKGGVESTKDANARFLTHCLDPLCDQLGEEITRKRYGYDAWAKGSYLIVDSSAILHFDLFDNAANVEKLIGSGAYTINEIRRAAGSPLIDEPWALKHWMTKNIADLAQAANTL